ncbi:flagellar biosynthesis protein FlhB [Sphingomonas arenae]|uniref:flagellar biosynthesis protein FlhB n=1 Tax=Sphingomonas arenae TaxID=2812555 RepID=UPI0019670673
MSEDQDSKTHAPTPKRLEDARRKGEVATAPEMRHAVMLLALLAACAWFATITVTSVNRLSEGLWGRAEDFRLDPAGAQLLASTLLLELARALLPMLGLFLVAGVAIPFIQGRPTLSRARLKLQWKKLNPFAGLKRLFGPQGLVEFAKTLAKCIAVLLICIWVLRPHLTALDQLVGMHPADILRTAGTLSLTLIKAVLLLVGAIAIFDFLYQHRAFLKRMRMSLQELKDEHKESDGNPEVKARQRQIAAARSRARMMSAIPTASVIVTNPTHYAIALKYDHGAMRAPVVVAKGTDLVALRIRELAAEHRVPIIESPPLARALYAGADVDRPIPVEFYAAVAEIISTVMKLARERRGAA